MIGQGDIKAMTHSADRTFLGVDLGTSKMAAVIMDAAGKVVADVSCPHQADLARTSGQAEQDAGRLLECARQVVRSLPANQKARLAGIGVTGQMHGVVVVDQQRRALTPLITWQDQRQQAIQMAEDLRRRTGCAVCPGYGCVTLALLTTAGMPATAISSGTIHDLFVAELCDLPRLVTDTTDAASWGLFDLEHLNWDSRAIGIAGIKADLLPQVFPTGALAGNISLTAAETLGLPVGIPVAVALGDNQASVLASLSCPDEELALTLGTGGQVSAVVTQVNFHHQSMSATCQYRPFPGGRWLLVVASLCGGSAWNWLADSITAQLHELGLESPARDELFRQLNVLGQRSSIELEISPHFLGERHAPKLRGQISGLTMTNFRVGAMARGLAYGIVRNLYTGLPPDILPGRRRIIASGNALRLNPLLRQAAQDVFGLPLVMREAREEAATGAAMIAASL